MKVNPTQTSPGAEEKLRPFSHRLHRYCRSEQSPARATREWSSRWTCSSFSPARNASLPGCEGCEVSGRLGTWWPQAYDAGEESRPSGEVTGQISGVENVPSYFNVFFLIYIYVYYIYIILYIYYIFILYYIYYIIYINIYILYYIYVYIYIYCIIYTYYIYILYIIYILYNIYYIYYIIYIYILYILYIYIIYYTVYRSLHFWRGFPSGQPCLKSLEVVFSLDQDEQAENIGQFGCQMVVTVWVWCFYGSCTSTWGYADGIKWDMRGIESTIWGYVWGLLNLSFHLLVA